MELGEGSEYTKNAWSFRLFDTGYWGGAVEISLAENVQNNHLKIDLTKTWMTAGDNSRKLDMTKSISLASGRMEIRVNLSM